MCSSTSLEAPRLVRIAMPRAQIRVAIEMHSQTNGGSRFDVRTEREHCHCSGEFEQLLLTCILIGSKFMLLHAHCSNS